MLSQKWVWCHNHSQSISLSRWRRTKLLAAKATKRRQPPWGHMERAVSICLVFPDISTNDHWVTRNMFISHMRTMLLV
jgi:hypothetical protein